MRNAPGADHLFDETSKRLTTRCTGQRVERRRATIGTRRNPHRLPHTYLIRLLNAWEAGHFRPQTP